MTSGVRRIAWQEFVLNRRNRWVIFFAVLFALTTTVISYFGMVTSGYAGFQDFIRTAASLANLGGFYMPGRDRGKWLDILGWIAVLGALAGVVLHAAGRFFTNGKNGKNDPK